MSPPRTYPPDMRGWWRRGMERFRRSVCPRCGLEAWFLAGRAVCIRCREHAHGARGTGHR